MEIQFEMIICIVNPGFADTVMNAARAVGATGGTVINGLGTIKEEAEKAFSISFTPDREIVMILVPKKIKNDILHELYKKVGLDTPGQGIAFSVPVDDVVGLDKQVTTIEKEEKKVN